MISAQYIGNEFEEKSVVSFTVLTEGLGRARSEFKITSQGTYLYCSGRYSIKLPLAIG